MHIHGKNRDVRVFGRENRMTRILSKYTNKDIKKGWKFIADSPLHLTPKKKILDQREIDIYVKIGYRKKKILQCILESVN